MQNRAAGKREQDFDAETESGSHLNDNRGSSDKTA
jgi:hypothetical protein